MGVVYLNASVTRNAGSGTSSCASSTVAAHGAYSGVAKNGKQRTDVVSSLWVVLKSSILLAEGRHRYNLPQCGRVSGTPLHVVVCLRSHATGIEKCSVSEKTGNNNLRSAVFLRGHATII